MLLHSGQQGAPGKALVDYEEHSVLLHSGQQGVPGKALVNYEKHSVLLHSGQLGVPVTALVDYKEHSVLLFIFFCNLKFLLTPKLVIFALAATLEYNYHFVVSFTTTIFAIQQ